MKHLHAATFAKEHFSLVFPSTLDDAKLVLKAMKKFGSASESAAVTVDLRDTTTVTSAAWGTFVTAVSNAAAAGWSVAILAHAGLRLLVELSAWPKSARLRYDERAVQAEAA